MEQGNGITALLCAAACDDLQWGETMVYRARLPAAAAAAAGVDMQDSSIFVQDGGRFVFGYPISSGDVVWTVGVQGEALGWSCQLSR